MPSVDVAIAGGGPAGSAAAVALARAGLRVTLVDGGGAPDRIEGLSPRAVALLAALGLPAEGVGPAVARQARWGGLTAAPNREHPVRRRPFDAALRAAAAEAGATVVRDAVRRVAAGGLDLGRGRLDARVVIEARGRRAAAPSRLRGPATVSVSGRLGPAEGEAAEIEALAEGWLWRADAFGARWAQLTLDAAAARAGLAAAWAAATALPFPDAPLVRAAELRLGATRPSPGVIRLGDASVAMDPLSGHGIWWALTSAQAAPALARAGIEGEAALLARWHAERVVATFRRQARIGRDFHAMAGRDGAFWRARAAWPDAAPAHAAVAAPFLRRQVVIRDGRLAEAEALVTAAEPDGAAFVRGVEIAPVLRRLGGLGRPAEVARACPELPQDTAADLAAWLVSRGAARPTAAA